MRSPRPYTIVPAKYRSSDLRNDLLFLPDFLRQSPMRSRFYKATALEMDRLIANGRVAVVDAERKIWQFVGELELSSAPSKRVQGGRVSRQVSYKVREVIESEMGQRPLREEAPREPIFEETPQEEALASL
ncbi:MAG: hypothetical protein ACRD8A_12780 [Candidatus Acidiferrales bacterium]